MPSNFDEIRHRARFEVTRVVVALAEREFAAALGLVGGLADGVVERTDAEGAVVEPVIAHPAVDHRALRHRGLERRMRIDLRHERRKAQVAGADDADLAVRLRRVLHQPLDGVVGVGRLVDAGVVQRPRPAGRFMMYCALGPVQAANVLVDADVAVLHELRIHHLEDVDDALAVRRMRSTRVRRKACATAGWARSPCPSSSPRRCTA